MDLALRIAAIIALAAISFFGFRAVKDICFIGKPHITGELKMRINQPYVLLAGNCLFAAIIVALVAFVVKLRFDSISAADGDTWFLFIVSIFLVVLMAIAFINIFVPTRIFSNGLYLTGNRKQRSNSFFLWSSIAYYSRQDDITILITLKEHPEGKKPFVLKHPRASRQELDQYLKEYIGVRRPLPEKK